MNLSEKFQESGKTLRSHLPDGLSKKLTVIKENCVTHSLNFIYSITVTCSSLLPKDDQNNKVSMDFSSHKLEPDSLKTPSGPYDICNVGTRGSLDNMRVFIERCNYGAWRSGERRVKFMACPDSGASRSLCGPKLAKKLGCKIHWEKISISNASGTSMKYMGTALCNLTFEGKTIKVPILLSSDVENRLIIGRHDLIRLHILPHDFPRMLPGKLLRKGSL